MLSRLLHWLRSPFTRESVGAWTEGLAAEWLQRERGFRLVVRNWRNPRDARDEIDLICRDREALVFVEVKARSASALVPGYFAVDSRKKRVLRRAAKAYLAGLRPRPQTFRLDIVEIVLPSNEATSPTQPEIRHFENVPLFMKSDR